jgi:hypothetical protein
MIGPMAIVREGSSIWPEEGRGDDFDFMLLDS